MKKKNKVKVYLFNPVDSLFSILLMSALVLLVLMGFAYLLKLEQWQLDPGPNFNYYKMDKFIRVDKIDDTVGMYMPGFLSNDFNADGLLFNDDILVFDLKETVLDKLAREDENVLTALAADKEGQYYFNTLENNDEGVINRLYLYDNIMDRLDLLLIEFRHVEDNIYDWQEEWAILGKNSENLYFSYIRGDYAPEPCHNYWSNDHSLYNLYGAEFYTGIKILKLDEPHDGFLKRDLNDDELIYGKDKTEACLENLFAY